MKKNKKRRDPNKELMLVAICFFIVFFAMGGYFLYFLTFASERVINNPYNHRQDAFAESVVRGTIYASDRTVLAETVINEDGSESRVYPYGSVFSHVVGYNLHGKGGIELQMNFNLLRSHIPFAQKLQNQFQGKKDAGDHVVTTLDVAIQTEAYKALGSHSGAVVVMDPSSGAVLSMVSKPDFDPGQLEDSWESWNEEGSTVLFNRAVSGLYPPGSTFKLVTLLEYIREQKDYASYSYDCTGVYSVDSFDIYCHNHEVHGHLDLGESVAHSCNTSFVNIGMQLNTERYRNTVEQLLWNQSLPTQFLVTKSEFTLTPEDSDFMKSQTVIGQGETLVTPMHMTMLSAAIANGGVLMKPYLVSEVVSAQGEKVLTYKPEKASALMTKEEAALLKGYMGEVTAYGTASSLSNYGYEIYGKTGTAQFGSDTNNHFWFTGFLKADTGSYAISVVVEDEAASSNSAVLVMRSLLGSGVFK